MGRRALQQVDPRQDLSSHLFDLEEWPEDRPVAEAFKTQRPLEIEVGSGKGLFIRNAAARHAERNFLGVEIAGKYARYAAWKLAAEESDNAAMFRGDGEKILRELVPDESLLAVHVYFPDPWWKTRHRKRRVMNETFVKRVVDVLKPGGSLHFWTDVEEYFHVTLRLLEAATPLIGPLEVPERTPEHDLDYRTHYERRMRKAGKPIYRSRFEKASK